MRLDYVGRATLMAVIGLAAIMVAAFAKQPNECTRFGTGSMYPQIKRPALPACLDNLMILRDQLSLSMCKTELSAYVDDMDQYSRCLAAENKEAIREGNEAIENYNCIARGSSVCY